MNVLGYAYTMWQYTNFPFYHEGCVYHEVRWLTSALLFALYAGMSCRFAGPCADRQLWKALVLKLLVLWPMQSLTCLLSSTYTHSCTFCTILQSQIGVQLHTSCNFLWLQYLSSPALGQVVLHILVEEADLLPVPFLTQKVHILG